MKQTIMTAATALMLVIWAATAAAYDIRPIKREVDDGIASIVTDIFCGTDDYTQTDDESRCAYCDFKALCGR